MSNPWMNQPAVTPYPTEGETVRYADPVAQAEIDRLRAKVNRIEDLFADRPDTVCTTAWQCAEPHEDWEICCRHRVIECVTVPAADLRAALTDPKESE